MSATDKTVNLDDTLANAADDQSHLMFAEPFAEAQDRYFAALSDFAAAESALDDAVWSGTVAEMDMRRQVRWIDGTADLAGASGFWKVRVQSAREKRRILDGFDKDQAARFDANVRGRIRDRRLNVANTIVHAVATGAVPKSAKVTVGGKDLGAEAFAALLLDPDPKRARAAEGVALPASFKTPVEKLRRSQKDKNGKLRQGFDKPFARTGPATSSGSKTGRSAGQETLKRNVESIQKYLGSKNLAPLAFAEMLHETITVLSDNLVGEPDKKSANPEVQANGIREKEKVAQVLADAGQLLSLTGAVVKTGGRGKVNLKPLRYGYQPGDDKDKDDKKDDEK